MNNSTDSSALEHTVWQLESFGDPVQPQQVLPAGMITLTFEGSRLNGSAGCNNYFATFTVAGDRLSVSAPGATRKMCAPEVMQQEYTYLQALALAERYELTTDQLTIICDSDHHRLIFRPGR